MWKASQRNLVVVSKSLLSNYENYEQQVKQLNKMLSEMVDINLVAGSNEVIDLNRCRHYKKSDAVAKKLLENKNSAFVFICNKN